MRGFVSCACFAVLVFAGAASAQDENDVNPLLREGARLARAGQHERAVELFERTRRLVPSDRVDLNLADSLIALGRWVRARELLTRLAEDTSVSPLIAELARERLATLRSRLGTIDVRVFPVPENAFLTLDGRRHAPVAESMELQVAPGPHRIVLVTNRGQVLARTHVDVAPQSRRSVELTPIAPPREPLAVIGASAQSDAPSTDPWPWIGVIGAIAVAAAVAIVLGVVLTEPQPVAGTVPTIRLPGEP